MKEPNIVELRKENGVPEDALFYGWLIHNPVQDDFLHQDKSKKDAIMTTWIMNPEKALRFTRYVKAHKALVKLELEHKALIVPAFDIGKAIMVALDRKIEPESGNPFRQLAELASDNQ